MYRPGLIAFALLVAACSPQEPAETPPQRSVRIAVAHLAPTPGDFGGNTALIERAVRTAASSGAQWVVTPELAESGYEFARHHGIRGLPQFPDPWLQHLAEVTRETGTTLFLGFPKRQGERFRNAVVAIDEGEIVASHAKINVLREPLEDWAEPGRYRAMHVDGKTIGYYVCADAINKRLTRRYLDQGAQILLSSAAWYPFRDMGPLPVWRRVSERTGLPFVVANTTGQKGKVDFRGSPSGALVDGRIVDLDRTSADAVMLFDWNGQSSLVSAGRLPLAD